MSRYLACLTAAALGSLLLSGCAGTGTTAPSGNQRAYYTEAEKKGLSACVELSFIARMVALKKQEGTPSSEVKARVADGTNKLVNQIVDRVYADEFDSVWEYNMAFFKQCAGRVGKVPEDRMEHASACNAMVTLADTTFMLKDSGHPKSKAYGYIGKVKSDVPRKIVDEVYATEMNRKEFRADFWGRCIDKTGG